MERRSVVSRDSAFKLNPTTHTAASPRHAGERPVNLDWNTSHPPGAERCTGVRDSARVRVARSDSRMDACRAAGVARSGHRPSCCSKSSGFGVMGKKGLAVAWESRDDGTSSSDLLVERAQVLAKFFQTVPISARGRVERNFQR